LIKFGHDHLVGPVIGNDGRMADPFPADGCNQPSDQEHDSDEYE